MRWQFIDNGFSDGRTNMKADEDLARRLVEASGLPTVRVYGWNPPAISLGWNQSKDEILHEKARREGVDVVRRPTGGRAILHAGELTYCVVMSVAEGTSVSEVYRHVSEGLLAGLEDLGVSASLEKSQPHFPSLYRNPDSVSCFVSSARHEIKVSGRKLVGSAQRRYRGRDAREIVLQHGSILIDPSHRAIVRYLALDEDRRASMAQLLRERTTDLSEILERTVSFEEVAEAIRKGMERAWEIEFDDSPELMSTGRAGR